MDIKHGVSVFVNLICKYVSDIGGSIHYDNLMCLICGWVERDNGNRSKLSDYGRS